MARKPKSETNKTAQVAQLRRYDTEDDATWGGFLNLRLDDTQRGYFFDWYAENLKETNQQVDDFLGEGGKVSFSYDAQNQAYIVTFTGALTLNHAFRESASSRAPSLDEAIALMVYKHVIIAGGNWGNFKPKHGTMSQWG
jgi:hypothetical protein